MTDTEATQGPETVCPFGSELQKYWDRLSPLERQMELDAEALYSLIVQEAALRTAAVTPGNHIIDAFAGAGGSAIGFARSGKKVTAVELHPHRLEMAKRNAALFQVADRIDFILGDALVLLPNLPGDTVFLSPPWGGPGYSKRPLFNSVRPADKMEVRLRCGWTAGLSLTVSSSYGQHSTVLSVGL